MSRSLEYLAYVRCSRTPARARVCVGVCVYVCPSLCVSGVERRLSLLVELLCVFAVFAFLQYDMKADSECRAGNLFCDASQRS